MAIDPLARGFANEADAYELGRPGWPDDAIDAAFEQLGLGQDAILLELGAGTGKLTRSLLQRARRVIPIEPLEEMRAVLARTTGIEARDGTAESIPVVTGSVDAVFAGEAFHWFHGPAARDEIVRVLRRSGGLAVMWNRARGDPEPWMQELKDVLDRRRAPGARPENRYASMVWRASLEGDLRFGPLEESSWPHERTVAADDYVAMFASWSNVAGLDPDDRTQTIDELRELLAAYAVDEVVERLQTKLYVTRLTGLDE